MNTHTTYYLLHKITFFSDKNEPIADTNKFIPSSAYSALTGKSSTLFRIVPNWDQRLDVVSV